MPVPFVRYPDGTSGDQLSPDSLPKYGRWREEDRTEPEEYQADMAWSLAYLRQCVAGEAPPTSTDAQVLLPVTQTQALEPSRTLSKLKEAWSSHRFNNVSKVALPGHLSNQHIALPIDAIKMLFEHGLVKECAARFTASRTEKTYMFEDQHSLSLQDTAAP